MNRSQKRLITKLKMLNKKILLSILVLSLFIAIPTAEAEEDWWNNSWHYRIEVNTSITAESENVSIVIEDLNFTQILNDSHGSTDTFYANSLRVIDSNNDTHPLDFENTTEEYGNVSWIANITMSANTNYTYYIYFDVSENEALAQGDIISDIPYWRSGHLEETIWDHTSNETQTDWPAAGGGQGGIGYEWNRTWAQGVRVIWKYAVAADGANCKDYGSIYINGVQSSQKCGVGSEELTQAGSRVYANYTTQYISVWDNNVTDSYGTYGVAVDQVKFYTTANITEPTVTTDATHYAQPTNITIATDKESYATGETINVSGGVTDLDWENINGTIFLQIFNQSYESVYSNSTAVLDGEWQHLITNIALGEEGNYTINSTFFNSSYYANSTTEINISYRLDEYPEIDLYETTPASGGWGENYTFSINVSDDYNSAVTMTLYVNISESWVALEEQTVTSPAQINWSYVDFSCSEIGIVTYILEYNDTVHPRINSSEYTGPTLSANNIDLIYWQGNNSIVNRSSSQTTTFGITANDTTKDELLSNDYNLTFEVNLSDNWVNFANGTLSSGNATTSFNPSCSYSTGDNSWRARYEEGCYQSATTEEFNLSIYGDLLNSLEEFENNFSQGDTITFNLTLTDDCGSAVADAQATINLSTEDGTDVDEDAMSFVSGSLYNYAWDSSSKTVSNYTVAINTSVDNHNLNMTVFTRFFEFTHGPPLFALFNQSITYISQNLSVYFNLSITDQSETNISQVTLTLQRPNGTIESYNFSNVTEQDLTESNWTFEYNGNDSSTMNRGIYYLNVTPTDGSGVSAMQEANITVYANMSVNISTGSDSYSREDTATIRYNITDLHGNGIQPQINFSVTSPDQDQLYLNNGDDRQTNTDGILAPIVTFTVPTAATAGSYIASAQTTFADPLAGYTTAQTDNHTFTISSSTSDELHVDIESTPFWYGDNTAKFYVTVYGGDGSLTDADDIEAAIYNPDFVPVADISGPTNIGTGLYRVQKTFSAPISTTGMYTLEVNATVGSITTSKLFAFRLTNGGPFQFEIYAPTQGTIGQDMSFTVNATNEGGASAESNFACWIQSGDTVLSGETTFAQEIDAGENWVISKTILVPSSLAANTDYLLKCTLTISDSNWEPSNASDTFTAVAATTTEDTATTTPGGGGTSAAPATTVPAYSEISIINVPDEVLLERDSMEATSIIVKNTGDTTLMNIQLEVLGLPSTWTISDLKTINVLEVGQQKEFVFQIYVPKTANAGTHIATLQVSSDKASTNALVTMRVFESKEELLRYKIAQLASKITELRDRIVKLSSSEKAQELIEILSSAALKLADADTAVERGDYNEATSKLNQATVLVQATEDKLNAAEGPIEVFFSLYSSTFNWLTYAALIIIILILILGIIYSRRLIKTFNKLRNIRVVSNEKTSELELRLHRAINMIDDQYQRGMLTRETYEELRTLKERALRAAQLDKLNSHGDSNHLLRKIRNGVYDNEEN
jgi:hypothetical protein